MGRKPYKFTPKRQEAYLELLADGKGRLRAAFEVGLNPKTIERHVAAEPAFLELRDLAEMRRDDDMEESLFESGRSGNVTAAIKWLEAKRPEVWKEVKEPALGSALNPLHVAAVPGAIDWDAIPLELAKRIIAIDDELKALQPASGGLIVNQDGSVAE